MFRFHGSRTSGRSHFSRQETRQIRKNPGSNVYGTHAVNRNSKKVPNHFKGIRNAPKEEGEDPQSETNTVVIDEPLQQTNPS